MNAVIASVTGRPRRSLFALLAIALATGTLIAVAVAFFLAGCAIWLLAEGSPIVLLPALLVPDLSMVGYLAGPRAGVR